jgi:ATP-dependent Clp protease ATP-binding subunit ClpA
VGYVQSPTPSDATAHGHTHEETGHLADAPLGDAPLSDELTLVVTGARRRAVRDGDRQIDTAHLLHSLLEADPEVRAAFADTTQVARLLGYLVQRSIGYGLQWQGAVEDSGAVPVVGTAPGWSPLVAAAMEAGVERAASRGDGRARGVDVLAALAADMECRAVEVLGRAGVDVALLRQRLN